MVSRQLDWQESLKEANWQFLFKWGKNQQVFTIKKCNCRIGSTKKVRVVTDDGSSLPQYGIILQNKDDLKIPLDFETIPTPKARPPPSRSQLVPWFLFCYLLSIDQSIFSHFLPLCAFLFNFIFCFPSAYLFGSGAGFCSTRAKTKKATRKNKEQGRGDGRYNRLLRSKCISCAGVQGGHLLHFARTAALRQGEEKRCLVSSVSFCCVGEGCQSCHALCSLCCCHRCCPCCPIVVVQRLRLRRRRRLLLL